MIPGLVTEDTLRRLSGDGEPFSPAALAAADLEEAFPANACAALDAAGLPACYVPIEHGGLLANVPQVVTTLRAIASRDLTVAIAHGKTFLGAVSVWVAGTPEMAKWLGAEIAEGAVVSWGLTEHGHGSDLLAGEVTAEAVDGGWRIDGEKWLINNATRADIVCVLARTAAAGGPRGFSLFLIDKRELPADRLRHTPKIATHGIRGADISGISFTAAMLPSTAVVGKIGEGGETVLKALQLTRTACAALSLGAGDHAIGLATRFAAGRQVHGRPLAELPLVRGLIGRAAARLLLAEAVTTVATRGIHVVPGEMSVLSAVCKAFVPTMVQEAIDGLAELMGARGYLTEVFSHGEFAKLDRDHRLVGIFDGSTLVNRHLLITQFPRLGRKYGTADVDSLHTLVTGELPTFELGKLTLMSKVGCSLTRAIPELARQITTNADEATSAVVADFAAASTEVHAELAAYRPTSGMPGASAFRLAERYELCVAGAACLLIRVSCPAENETAAGASLQLVVEKLRPERPLDDEVFDQLGADVLRGGRPSSILAGGTS